MIPDFSAMPDGHLFLAILFPVAAALSLYYAWRGLRGTRRSWVFYQYLYTPLFNSGHLNNLPLRAGAGGAFALVLWADVVLEYTDHPEFAKGWPIMALFAATLLLSILGAVWWPPFLAPRWYRDWQASGEKGRCLPFTEQEIGGAHVMPDGQEKDQLLREIQKCRDLLTTLRSRDQRRTKAG